MSELQAGMLAMVINASNQSNIGKIVDVIRPVIQGEPIPEIRDRHISTIDGWLVTGNIQSTGGHVGIGTSYAKDLMPLPPLADPLDVTHKEELHA